ncbi:hypothetical protein pb186bvf_015684 [Paramecium bursaria]
MIVMIDVNSFSTISINTLSRNFQSEIYKFESSYLSPQNNTSSLLKEIHSEDFNSSIIYDNNFFYSISIQIKFLLSNISSLSKYFSLCFIQAANIIHSNESSIEIKKENLLQKI